MLNVIDVSVYQPDIDYAAVKAAGIDGAVLRCGFTGWGSSHSLNKDTKFEAHYAGFTGAGIPVGAYYYSTADSVNFAKKEAGFVQSLLKGKKLALPVYYDIENNERQAALSMSLLTQIAEAFCASMEEAGYFVGVYANTNWFTNKLNHAALSEKYTVWLADYRGANANKTLQRDMWQYTSTGKVNGINGNVDLNECYRDFPSIIKAAGLNGYAKEAGSTPAPAPEPEGGGTYTRRGAAWGRQPVQGACGIQRQDGGGHDIRRAEAQAAGQRGVCAEDVHGEGRGQLVEDRRGADGKRHAVCGACVVQRQDGGQRHPSGGCDQAAVKRKERPPRRWHAKRGACFANAT